MNDPTIYSCFLVHGAPVYVQFRDLEDYMAWCEAERSTQGNALRITKGQDGESFLLRPSSVDAIFPGRRMSDAD